MGRIKNPYRHIIAHDFNTVPVVGRRYSTWCGKRTDWQEDDRPYCVECVHTLMAEYNKNADLINTFTDQILAFQRSLKSQN